MYHTKPGGITAKHLASDRLVLNLFDTLLVLEHDEAASSLAFRYGLGWNTTLKGHNARSSSQFVGRSLIEELVPRDIEALFTGNKLDVELYQYANQLAKLDQVVWALAKEAGEGRGAGEHGAGGDAAVCGFFDARSTVGSTPMPKWMRYKNPRKMRGKMVGIT